MQIDSRKNTRQTGCDGHFYLNGLPATSFHLRNNIINQAIIGDKTGNRQPQVFYLTLLLSDSITKTGKFHNSSKLVAYVTFRKL